MKLTSQSIALELSWLYTTLSALRNLEHILPSAASTPRREAWLRRCGRQRGRLKSPRCRRTLRRSRRRRQRKRQRRVARRRGPRLGAPRSLRLFRRPPRRPHRQRVPPPVLRHPRRLRHRPHRRHRRQRVLQDRRQRCPLTNLHTSGARLSILHSIRQRTATVIRTHGGETTGKARTRR